MRFPFDFQWISFFLFFNFNGYFIEILNGFPLVFHRNFNWIYKIYIVILLKFLLNFNWISSVFSLVFHGNFYRILTGFLMDFHCYRITISIWISNWFHFVSLQILLNFDWISNGFQLECNWNFYGYFIDNSIEFIEISNGIPWKFQLDFQWFSVKVKQYFIEISNGISLNFNWI